VISVCLKRLHVDGYQVADRPRPQSVADVSTLSTNHGGVAVVTGPGVRLQALDLRAKSRSFELLCFVRVVAGSSSSIVIVVNRPGSASVTSVFFDELADVLDRVATFTDPIFLLALSMTQCALELCGDPSTRQFNDILSAYGFGRACF
jgi:hypothetical protein